MVEEAKTKELVIPRLFSSLQRAINDEDDEEVLEFTKSILDLSCDDQDALNCRLVSFIHLSKFTAALGLIRDQTSRSTQYQFEEAYCLYRLDKYEESLCVLSRLPEGQFRVCELRAQVLYRLEEYAKSYATYKQLLGEEMSGAERRANFYAAASLSSSSVLLKGDCTTERMEQCFNLACWHLVRGSGLEAGQLLAQAESLCRASLEEEGLSEEEVMEEMSVIHVQKGYTAQVCIDMCLDGSYWLSRCEMI